jgi:hypothetical protein
MSAQSQNRGARRDARCYGTAGKHVSTGTKSSDRSNRYARNNRTIGCGVFYAFTKQRLVKTVPKQRLVNPWITENSSVRTIDL